MHDVTDGPTLSDISSGLIHALDADVQDAEARRVFSLSEAQEPTTEQLKKASKPLKEAAIAPLMQTPALRKLLIVLRQRFEQIVDGVSIDKLVESQTGYSADAKEKAQALVKSFEAYLAEHKEEIDALQFFYSLPHKRRLRFKDIQKLADAIKAPPRSWTPERLWRAYETLEKDKVHRASAQTLLTDMVSLVRFALKQDGELVPHAERVHSRFESWLGQQENKGRAFSDEQRQWLGMMRDHIATSLEMEVDDFDLTPFTDAGGRAKASRVFGKELPEIVRELNEVLAA